VFKNYHLLHTEKYNDLKHHTWFVNEKENHFGRVLVNKEIHEKACRISDLIM